MQRQVVVHLTERRLGVVEPRCHLQKVRLKICTVLSEILENLSKVGDGMSERQYTLKHAKPVVLKRLVQRVVDVCDTF